MSEVTRELREELNALSKEIFGVPSKWRKILNKGHVQMVTRKVTEATEEGKEPVTKEVPVLTSFGAKQSIIKRYTVEEVHTLLLDYKRQRDEMMAKFEQKAQEAAAKKAEEKAMKLVQETAQGSAAV